MNYGKAIEDCYKEYKEIFPIDRPVDKYVLMDLIIKYIRRTSEEKYENPNVKIYTRYIYDTIKNYLELTL